MNCFYILLSFSFSFILEKKKIVQQDCFCVGLCCPVFAAGIHVSVGLNTNQIEEGKQYSKYSVERNPRAYMSMRDYRNLPWQWQQPIERNPNPCRSMREYRDQWKSTPSYSVIPTYEPPPHPQYASLSQPQPPQPISPVEQAILDLTKMVGDAVEEQKKFNAQLSQKIHTVENPLEQKLDGFQSKVGQQFNSLQCSISNLAQQLDHQGEENPEEECQIDTMAEEQCKQQPHQGLIEDFIELSEGLSESSDMCDVVFPRENQEEILPFITEEGSGKEIVEEPQELVLKPFPTKLNPTATAQAIKSPLPIAPSTDQVYILPSPAPQPTSEAPTTKASLALPALKSLKKLVATVRASATTSKTQAAYIA